MNGRIGIREAVDLADWTVRVVGVDGELLDELDITHFEALPQRDLVVEHKCIEGWSSIVHWGGVRYADFRTYADRTADARWVGLATPTGSTTWAGTSRHHPSADAAGAA
ncbi:MAG: hypothetical protein R2695_01330 [Acidimicrobiales bacterium]